MDASRNNMDVGSCPGCAAAAKKITALEARNAALQAQNATLKRKITKLEQALEAASRAGKRQAAPFSRGSPKTNPKRPGRKAGENYGTKAFRAVPQHIDEVHEAPLPECCPHCGGHRFTNKQVRQQYQAEIPRRPIYRQFNVAVAYCSDCGKRVQGHHPLQTSDALGCCASQVGPEAQAAVVMLNKTLGLSQGKVSGFFQMFFGITLTRGATCQIMLRAAKRCEGHYQAIVKWVRESDWIVPDETGWRIGGWNAWLHVAVTAHATAYLIAYQRGFEASALLIGEDYEGTLIHDGWAPYLHFILALHQTCLGHLFRRCKELLEVATGGAVLFPRKVKGLLQEALVVRDRRDAGEIPPATAVRKAKELERRMETLLAPSKTHAGNERLAKHLWEHQSELFTFLRFPGIDATNYRAEQAIRPGVVNRKVWGGNRTEAGAVAQAVLMTVLVTCRQRGCDALNFLSRTLRHQGPSLALLPAGP
jgi:transposase